MLNWGELLHEEGSFPQSRPAPALNLLKMSSRVKTRLRFCRPVIMFVWFFYPIRSY